MKKLKWGWIVMLSIVLLGQYTYAVDTDSEKFKKFEQRLNALEKHLGLPSSKQKTTNIDDLLQRLEALEKTVYESEQPAKRIPSTTDALPTTPKFKPATEEVAVPPPEGAETMDWEKWEGGDPGSYLTSGLDIWGYAETSFVWDDKRDMTTFSADVIELDLTKQLTDWAVMGADLDFINERRDPVRLSFFRHPGYALPARNVLPYSNTSIGGDDDDDFIMEQLFLRVRPMENLEVTSGKFNVPVGLEQRDASRRFNVIPSQLFYLWPRDLTGVMATYQVNDQLAVSPYIFNGWDNDENINDSFIYALYTNYQVLNDINLAATVAYGPPFHDNDEDDAFLFDAELRYTGIENFFAGLEYMFVTTETNNLPSSYAFGTVQYQGLLGQMNYRFSDLFGLTLQSSMVVDDDGFLWGLEDDIWWEASVIPSLYFTKDIELRLQYQHQEATDGTIGYLQKDGTTVRREKSNDVIFLSLFWNF